MDMNIRDELASLIADFRSAGDFSEDIADGILAKFGVIPLDGVERVERISGGVEFDVNGETAAWVNGAMRTPHGYWNVRVGDDPTPAIAAMILAMREAQGACDA